MQDKLIKVHTGIPNYILLTANNYVISFMHQWLEVIQMAKVVAHNVHQLET